MICEKLRAKIVDKFDFLYIISHKLNRGEPIERTVKGFVFCTTDVVSA